MTVTLRVGGVLVLSGMEDPSITIRSTDPGVTMVDTREIAHRIGLLAYKFLDPVAREWCAPDNEIGFYRTVFEPYSPSTGEMVVVWRISSRDGEQERACLVAVVRALTRCNVYLKSDTIAS